MEMNVNCGKLTSVFTALFAIVFVNLTSTCAVCAESGDAEPAGEALYTEIVAPFIKQHCLACHGAKTAKAGQPSALISSREIATGFGYASSQEAFAHFGLGERTTCDVVVTFPHGQGKLVRESITVDQRITVSRLVN